MQNYQQAHLQNQMLTLMCLINMNYMVLVNYKASFAQLHRDIQLNTDILPLFDLVT